MSEEPPAVRFGAAYYAEYQRTPNLKADFDLMAEAGFTVIRVGESVWSTWEPEDGALRPRLARAGPRRGARARHRGHPRHADLRDPDVAQAPLSRDRGRAARPGQPIGWGARQEVDFTHAAYLFHAERIIRAVVTRYREHPPIIGYQVDNEPGLRLLHNDERLRAVRRLAAPALRHRRDRSTRSGAWSTGRTGSRPGPTCGGPTGTSSRSTTSPGGGSRPSSSPTSSAGRPTSSASSPTRRSS